MAIQIEPGQVISEGTLNTDDLYYNFSAAVEQYAPRVYQKILDDFPDDEDGYWSAVMTGQTGELEAMKNALRKLAPEGTYFGPHPDDRAKFGFWPYKGGDCDD